VLGYRNTAHHVCEFPHLHGQSVPLEKRAADRTPGRFSGPMNAGSELTLPTGTAVYCCPRGMVFSLSRQSPEGIHILRTEVPLMLCERRYRDQLQSVVGDFRRAAIEQGFGA